MLLFFTRHRRSAEFLTKILLPWLSAAIVLGGSIVGVMEYLNTKEENRIKETFSFLRHLDKKPYLTAHSRIRDAMVLNHKTLKKAKLIDEENGERDFILDLVQRCRLETDLHTLTYFLNQVLACVESELCDEASANVLFESATQFYGMFFPFMEEERKTTGSVLFGLKVYRKWKQGLSESRKTIQKEQLKHQQALLCQNGQGPCLWDDLGFPDQPKTPEELKRWKKHVVRALFPPSFERTGTPPSPSQPLELPQSLKELPIHCPENGHGGSATPGTG